MLIAGITVACTAAAAVIAWSSRPIYRATALVRLADARGSITQGIEGAPQSNTDRTNPLLSQVQLIRARRLAGKIIDSLGLRVHLDERGLPPDLLTAVSVNPSAASEDSIRLLFSPDEITVAGTVPRVRVKYGDTISLPNVQLLVKTRPNVARATVIVSSREKTIDWLLNELRVAPRDQTDVVEVSFTDPDPARAQQIVNGLVQDYQAANIEAARVRARRRREFLEEQLRVISPQLTAAEQELASFRSRQEGFDFGSRMQAEQGAILSLDAQRHQLQAERTAYQSLLSTLEQRNSANEDIRGLGTADIGTNPAIVQLYEQLTRYQGGRDSLTTGQWRSAPTNPDVIRFDSLVAVTRRRLVDAVRGHISLLDARNTALGALRDQSAKAIQQLPGAQSTEERLTAQVTARRGLVEGLTSEYQKARMAEAVEVGQVEIVDFASRPYRPEPGLRLLKLAAGLLFGLLVGVGAAFLRERTNVAIRRRGELEGEMRVPVLSIIPRMYTPEETESTSRLSGVLRRSPREADGRDTVAGPTSLADAEAYRVLRTNLHWSAEGVESPKTLVVTSAMTREGKSMVSANLALAFALEGRRTLLVDCDLRRAKLHRVFGVPRSPGLAHILAGHITPSAAIRNTFLRGLHFLPAGRLNSLASDLLGVVRTRKILDELSECFDIVIIDTPPVLSVADAAILAAEAGGVLLVVRAGETNREAVNQTLRQLDVVGARVLGAVLNDPSGEVKRYGDYYATTDYDAVGD